MAQGCKTFEFAAVQCDMPDSKKFTNMSFSELNDDMISEILSFCNLKQVLSSIMLVCKKWYTHSFDLKHLQFSKTFWMSEVLDDGKTLQSFRNLCQSSASHFVSDLSLHHNFAKCAKYYLSSPYLKNVTKLQLGHNESDKSGSSLQAFKELIQSEYVKNVTELNLHRYRLEDAGIICMTQSSYLKNLTCFKTYWNGFELEGITLMSSHAMFSNLTHLEMTDVKGDTAFKYICDSPNFKQLTHLDIGQSYITNLGMEYLANSPYLTQLQVLKLDRCNFDGEGVRLLCESNNSIPLKELDFEYTYIGDEGVKYIAQSPNMKNLTSLGICNTDSGNEAAKYIAQSPYLSAYLCIRYEQYDPYYEGKFIDAEGEKLLDNRTVVASEDDENL